MCQVFIGDRNDEGNYNQKVFLIISAFFEKNPNASNEELVRHIVSQKLYITELVIKFTQGYLKRLQKENRLLGDQKICQRILDCFGH